MNGNEQLENIRKNIDDIDQQIVSMFISRMQMSEEVAKIKRENNLSILDASREQMVVDNAVAMADQSLGGEVAMLMRSIMALSREHQRKELFSAEIPLLPEPRQPIRENSTCAYQGVPGAWSEQALIQLFPDAKRENVEFFEDVFLAVKNKKADYGIVAIENSQTGAIGETYDLLRKYGCFIVGRTVVDAHHCLLAPKGIELNDIREVFSHPEGFKQCAQFLHGRAWDLTACRNTAVAAEMAAKANNGRTAAIGSRRAGKINNLEVLAEDIMDSRENRTAFVVIASQPEYNQESDIISITFSTAHRSGALCETLLPFMALGINLIRIESRPAAPGKYRFFADIQGNIQDTNIVSALRQATSASEYFEVIGCYRNTQIN